MLYELRDAGLLTLGVRLELRRRQRLRIGHEREYVRFWKRLGR